MDLRAAKGALSNCDAVKRTRAKQSSRLVDAFSRAPAPNPGADRECEHHRACVFNPLQLVDFYSMVSGIPAQLIVTTATDEVEPVVAKDSTSAGASARMKLPKPTESQPP
jgi:hypothetical protein